MSTRYEGARVRRSLLHFFLGKGVSAPLGFVAMLLVVRLLTVEDFAAYSVLVGLVDIVGAVSSIGLAHALVRYVPELYAKQYGVSLKRLILGTTLLRTAILIALIAIAWLYPGIATRLVGLMGEEGVIRLFLLIILFRATSHFLSQVLESTLHQGIAQLCFTLATASRLLGMIFLAARGAPNLYDVILVEVIGEAISLGVMVAAVLRVMAGATNQTAADSGDATWLVQHIRQIFRFALAGYVQHLAILPYGGNTNRIAGSYLLGTSAMAGFGFAQSLYEYAKRYLPAQLLIGMIRPILISRYSTSGDFSAASRLVNRVLYVNLLAIGLLVVPLLVGAVDLLGFLSAGKYGIEAFYVLIGLSFILVLETKRQLIEVLVQSVERYDLLLAGNTLLSASILLALFLVPVVGAIGFPVANSLGLIFANVIVLRSLGKTGYRHGIPWHTLVGAILPIFSATVIGWALRWVGVGWLQAMVGAFTCYVLLIVVLREGELRAFYGDLVSGSSNGIELPPLEIDGAHDTEQNKPIIAFGVLSCRKESEKTIAEIADLVFPHTVIIHHDYSKCPDFNIVRPNVRIMKDYVVTGWGGWSLVDATLRLLRDAFSDPQITHFQLLSESCLPVCSIEQFVSYLNDSRAVAMIDLLPMNTREVFSSHGWRYMPGGAFSRRVVQRLSIWYRGPKPSCELRANINLTLPGPVFGLSGNISRWILGMVLDISNQILMFNLRRNGIRHLAIGGQWFAVNRSVGNWILACVEKCPQIVSYHQGTHIPDEAFVQTLIWNAKPYIGKNRLRCSNHVIRWHENGSGPDLLDVTALDDLLGGQRCFARKFPLDVSSEVRSVLIERLRCAQVSI